MGQIFVEGVGAFEIDGNVPTEEEMDAINEIAGNPDDEGDPTITAGQAMPAPVVPPGIGLERTRTGKEPAKEGPLGIMPVEARARTREVIESQPGLVQFATELTPAALGAASGAAMGAPLGPPGIIGGGIIGGIAGELGAQETGLAPSSELNLALAGLGPMAGPAMGGAKKLVALGIGKGIAAAPFAKTALSRNVMGRAINAYENIGTQILAKQQGLMSRGTSDLFDAAKKAGAKVDPDMLKDTRAAIEKLANELAPLTGFDEVNQSRKVLKNVVTMLLDNPDGVAVSDLMRARKFVGVAIANASSKTRGGTETLNTANQVFKAMASDLEKIATSPFGKGRAARLGQAAVKRARLGFAIDKMEDAVARFTTKQGDDAVIDFKRMQNWLDDITNPKNKKAYDKNFVNALKDELPRLKESVKQLAEIGSPSSPGGPGALVLRGQGAKIGRSLGGTAAGAILGANVGGPVGAALGGVAGAQLPEMMVGILTTKPGAAFLERASKLGQGQMNTRMWALMGEVMMRSLGQKNEKVPFSITADEARARMEKAARGEALAPGALDESSSLQPGEAGAEETAAQGRGTRRKRPRLPPEALERISRETQTGS